LSLTLVLVTLAKRFFRPEIGFQAALTGQG